MNKFLKSAYQFGSLGGLLSGAAFYVLSFLNPDPTNLNLIFGYLITPIAVFLAIKFYKDYHNDGFLSFAEGMSVGFLTYSMIGAISTLIIWIIINLSPELFEAIKSSKWQVINENKDTIVAQVGEESFKLTLENVKNMTSWDVAFNDGIWKIVPGMFFSIIISIILRKNPN